MSVFISLATSLFLILAFLSNALPCGPGYTTPLFDTTNAPENPYSDYAAGRLGIVKPTFHRSVLYAAYRHIAGSGLNAAEQRAMIEVWTAEIDNKDFRDDSVDQAVKAWVDKRKEVVGKDEKTPEIYAERSYGGYEFFPNCTKNAFETAAETLSDRATAHGPNDPNVGNWIKAQDQVFENCASGKKTPDDAPPGAPEWLQKDRAYQLAAAAFYSLDYNDAKRRFAEIALDSESPWAETADYLVARTLIRQASLSKTSEKAAPFYGEAEIHLQRFISRSGKFSDSAERLMGLIKYRLHPRERVSELANKLSGYGGNENFRQDVIDYNWLLDKYESEVLTVEEKRKAEEAPKNLPVSNANTASAPPNAANVVESANTTNENSLKDVFVNANATTGKRSTEVLQLNLYVNEKSYTVYLKYDATDDEAITEAEKVVGQPLIDDQRQQVRDMRHGMYAARFSEGRRNDYERGYWGDEKLTPSMVPNFLRQDALTDWILTYQMAGPEAYLYSLNKFKATGSELWLMTALSKADKASTGLARLIEAANGSSRLSPAYTTIAYHMARILLSQGKTVEARKLLDEMINSGDELPISARNSFIGLRLKLAATMEDFLKDSLRRAWGFDFDGEKGSVDDIIARQKTYYDPEYNKDGREAFDAEVESRYQEEKLWQSRLIFDSDTIEVFNQHFPTAALIDVMRSSALPDYMRERFAIAIWTRAFFLNDNSTLTKVTPDLLNSHPEFGPSIAAIRTARTPAAREKALMYFVLKNPLLSPYIEEGIGKTDNEQGQFDSNDWWCAPYDTEYDGATNAERPKQLPSRPAFLTAAQSQAAQGERKRLRDIGDAPKYLAEKVMIWAKRYPADRRIPEALYIMIDSNGWTKYGCGNNEELRDEMAAYLKKHYPNSEWTAKLKADETS